MKKRLAAISSILVFSLLLSSCGQPGNGKKKPFDDDNTTPSTAVPTPAIPMGKPRHNLALVDVKATYDDFYVDDFSKPWGADKKLRMANTVSIIILYILLSIPEITRSTRT